MALRYETERFIRCCDIPPKVECCDCPNGISTLWDVQNDLSGMYSQTYFGLKFAWGCTKYENPGVKRLEHTSGPLHPGQPSDIGDCSWFSESPQQAACCPLGCVASEGEPPPTSLAPLGIWMSCTISEEVPEIPALYQWWLDCACDDLWVGDSSEWGSLEDCLAYDTNCHCSNDEGAYSGDESSCNAIKAYYESLGISCGECEYREVYPAIPGTPRYVSHTAGLSGSGCACNRAYVLLNPDDPLCKDMLDSVDSSNLEPFDCEGCNTYVLIQYCFESLTEIPNPCPCGLSNICNGADLPCMDCGCGDGPNLFACYGYPATLTLCPAESINPPSSDSDCQADVLCCQEMEALSIEAQSIQASLVPPEDSLHFSFIGTSTNGYLKKDSDGIYRTVIHPIKLEVNRLEQTLNGKKLTMLSEEVFIGRGRIGSEHLGFWVEVMA